MSPNIKPNLDSNTLINKANEAIKNIEKYFEDVKASKYVIKNKLVQAQNILNENAKLPKMESASEPIDIVWELGYVHTTLEFNKMELVFHQLQDLIAQATRILQMYVRIPRAESKLIEIAKGFNCGSYYFEQPSNYHAHLVMLAKIFVPKKNEETEGKTVLA